VAASVVELLFWTVAAPVPPVVRLSYLCFRGLWWKLACCLWRLGYGIELWCCALDFKDIAFAIFDVVVTFLSVRMVGVFILCWVM